MPHTETDLQMADRHIAEGERHVVQQEELITRLRAQGLPTGQAEEFLAEFQSTLNRHRAHRATMVADQGGDL